MANNTVQFFVSGLGDGMASARSGIWKPLAISNPNKLKDAPEVTPLTEIIKDDLHFKNGIVYTLSIIRKEWIPAIQDNRIKDIISIFGSNETSGPVMINQATDIDFTENTYKLVDNFYQINVAFIFTALV